MKKNRERQITYHNLEQVIKIVNSVIKENPGMTYEDFEFEVGCEWDSYYVTLDYLTEETEYEKHAREVKEKAEAEAREKYKREQYEALKKEFER